MQKAIRTLKKSAIILAVFDDVAVNLSYALTLWFRFDLNLSQIPPDLIMTRIILLRFRLLSAISFYGSCVCTELSGVCQLLRTCESGIKLCYNRGISYNLDNGFILPQVIILLCFRYDASAFCHFGNKIFLLLYSPFTKEIYCSKY